MGDKEVGGGWGIRRWEEKVREGGGRRMGDKKVRGGWGIRR